MPEPRGRTARGYTSPAVIGTLVGVLAIAGVAAGVIFTTHPFDRATPVASTASARARIVSSPTPGTSMPGTVAGSAGAAPPSPSVAPSFSPSATSSSQQRQAAASLATLLSQSVSDRNAVNAAYNDVGQCGPDLTQDAQTFQAAATSHQQLLSDLAAMPGLQSLPQAMIQDLRSAWQASASADSDFAMWAQDEMSNGCSSNSQADPNYAAADAPDSQATVSKTAFAQLWNPLAQGYGLQTYSQSDL